MLLKGEPLISPAPIRVQAIACFGAVNRAS
jgi:hypothetical protein